MPATDSQLATVAFKVGDEIHVRKGTYWFTNH